MASGMNNSHTNRLSSPPCRVCGGEASGFHYGVDSCEGCKGFFRRCLTQGMNSRCSNDEKCEITPVSRNSCQFCRLKKCVLVGMSKEGSRLGRRPKRLKQGPGGLDGQHSDFKSAANHASSSVAQQSPTYNGHVAKLGTSLQMLRCSEQIEGGDLQRNQHHNKSRLSEQDYYSSRSDCLKSASAISSSRGNADPQKFSPMMNPSRMSNLNRIQNGLSANVCYDDDLDFLGAKHQSVNNQTKYNYGNVHCDEDVVPSRSLVQEDDKKFVKDDISRISNFSDWGAFKFNRNTHNEMMPHHRMAPSYGLHTSVPTRTLADNFTIEHRDCSASYILNSFQERTCMFDTANECSYGGGGGEEKFQSNCQLKTAKEIERSDSECFVDYSKVSSAGQRLSCSSDEVGSLEESAVDVHEADAFPNSVDSDEDPFKRMSFAKTSEVRRLLNEIKGGISPQKIAIINQVIETITTSHLNTCDYTYAKVIAGLKKYEELKKSGQTSEDDLDPATLWKHFQDNMVPVLQRVVNFFKKLPGFSEIEQEDQVKLFKQGSFEVILTRYTKLFTKDAMFVPNMTIFVPRNIIHQMPMGDFFQDMFKFAEVFNGLCLSDEEIGLLTAVMIVCPYRVGLANVKAVEELNLLFLQSLYTYMTRNRPDGNDELFDKTFQILSLIRDINEVHSVKLKSLKMSSPELSFPPLHEEVYDLVQCSL